MIHLREFATTAAAAMLAMTLAAMAGDSAAPAAPLNTNSMSARSSAPAVSSAAKAAEPRPQGATPRIEISVRTEVAALSHMPRDARPQPALPPRAVMPAADLTAEAAAVAARLQLRVPPALAPYFNLYLYVSKAADGPWAQHLFVFHKDATGHLVFERSFPVSTGREQQEAYFTTTPTGLFELDPNRFYTLAHSHRWHDAPMPHAMFLDYSYRTQMSGVALHAATGHLVSRLGTRASGGCVRLPPEEAASLFARIEREERGEVPVLAFDDSRGTTNVRGLIARDGAGRPLMAPGFRALVVISDFSGKSA